MNATITLHLPTMTDRFGRITKPLLGVVILGSIFIAANRLIDSYEIGSALGTPAFALAALVAIAYRIINPYGWTLVLAGLGYRTSALACIRIWLLAESRRWLPGGVWGYASRAVQAEKLGVPVSVASASMLIELLVTMAAAVVVSLLGLCLHYEQLSGTLAELVSVQGGEFTGVLERCGVGNGYLPALVAVVTLAFAAVVYSTREMLYRKLHQFAARFQLLRGVSLQRPILLTALSYMTVMAAFNGCVNLNLLPIVDESGSVPMLVMIAATATAWIAGFLAFFSPGGILVREAALAALLLPWLPYEAGITLAVLSRLAQLLAEVMCMLPVLGRDPPQANSS